MRIRVKGVGSEREKGNKDTQEDNSPRGNCGKMRRDAWCA